MKKRNKRMSILYLLLFSICLVGCNSNNSSPTDDAGSTITEDNINWENKEKRFFACDIDIDLISEYFREHGTKKNSLSQLGSTLGNEEFDYYQIIDGVQGTVVAYNEFDFFPNTNKFLIGRYTKTSDSASQINTVYTFENTSSFEIYYQQSLSSAKFGGKHVGTGINSSSYQIVASANGEYEFTFEQIGDGYILPDFSKVSTRKSETSNSISADVPEKIYNGLISAWRFANDVIKKIDPSKSLTNYQSTITHSHTFSSDWTYNSEYHWHASTCGHDVVRDKEAHSFTNTVIEPTGQSGGYTLHECSVCGYSYKDNETSPLIYTVTWKNYNGTILETDANVPLGTLPHYDGSIPERDGDENHRFVFKGWSPDIKIVTEDIVYTATYTEYLIYKFVFASGHDKNIEILATDSIDNYFPANTSIKYTETKKYSYSWEKQSEFVYVEVVKEINVYLITYYLDGGSNSPNNPSSLAADESFELKNATGKKGYTFVGWYSDPTLTNQIIILSNLNSNISLYAKWVLTEYHIEYHLDGGDNNPDNPSTININQTVTLKSPSKIGYLFDGWFSDSQLTKRITALENISSDIHIYAKFLQKTYLLTFDCNGGSFDKDTVTISYNYGWSGLQNKTISINANENVPYECPEREGYIFCGWYLDENFINKFNFNEGVYEDFTLYAKWNTNPNLASSICNYLGASNHTEMMSTKKTYYFYVDDYVKSATIYFRGGATNGNWWRELTIFNCRTNESYSRRITGDTRVEKMINWSLTNQDALPGDVLQLTVSSNVSNVADCYVYFNVDVLVSTSTISDTCKIQATFDSYLDVPKVCSREGYRFLGWYTSDGQLVQSGYYQLDYEGIVYARWEEE